MSNSTDPRPVQTTTSAQGGLDFGDLLDAYDLATHGGERKNQEHGITECSKTLPNNDETSAGTCNNHNDEVHPTSPEMSNSENMSHPHSVASPADDHHGNIPQPTFDPSSLRIQSVYQADTSSTATPSTSQQSPADNRHGNIPLPAATSSSPRIQSVHQSDATPSTSQVSPPDHPLTIDTTQESSLQTLSRFVEELSSPQPRVAVLGSTCGNSGQTVDRSEAAVSPPSGSSGTGLCDRTGSEPECGIVDSSSSYSQERVTVRDSTRERSTSPPVVSSNNQDIQGNRLAIGRLSATCVQPDSANVLSVDRRTTEQTVNNVNCLNADLAMTTTSTISASSEECAKKQPSEAVTIQILNHAVSAGESCSKDNTVLSPNSPVVVDSSSSHQNSGTVAIQSPQGSTNTVSSLSNLETEASSATQTSTCGPSDQTDHTCPSPSSSSNSTEVVSVLVTDDRLQTVHVVGGYQTEMLSFNIENVPDSSGNEEAESTVTEMCNTNEVGRSNVTSSSSQGVDANEATDCAVSSPSVVQKARSESMDSLVGHTEAVGSSDVNMLSGEKAGNSSEVSTSNITSVAAGERRERQTAVQNSDNSTLQNRPTELTSKRVQDLFEETPVLMQCLGVDRPVITGSTTTEVTTSSSCVHTDSVGINRVNSTTSDVSSSSRSSKAGSQEASNQQKEPEKSRPKGQLSCLSGGAENPFLITPVSTSGSTDQPFIVTPLNAASGMDRPFVVTPAIEPVLSPGSVRSSNPSPVGSTSSNQTNNSPPAPTSTKQTSAGRENKRKRKNPTRSQNYGSAVEILTQPIIEEHQITQQSYRSPEDPLTLPVQVKHEKNDGELGSKPLIFHNLSPQITQESLPRITNVQSLHPALTTNISQNAPPRSRPQHTSKPRAKPSHKDPPNIIPSPGPSFPGGQNMYSASNFMSHLNDRANLRAIRPMNDYYPPINITPENALPPPPPPPSRFPPPPHQGYPPPYMPGGQMRMPMPYLPPPIRPINFLSRPTMQMDRPTVHLERGSIRIERPRMSSMNRSGVNIERHNMLQSTRPAFSSPFIDMGPQMADVYYSQPQGLLLPQQHHPPRAPLVIRPDCGPPLNLKKQPHPSSSDSVKSMASRPPTPASVPPQPTLNRNIFVSQPEVAKNKASAVIFMPPKGIPEGSNTTSVSKTVRIAPKKSPLSNSSVIVKGSASPSSLSSASKTASSDPDPSRISSDILKEQHVKTYKPEQPPEHLGFKDTLKTYKCQGCGDEFLFSTSLVNHLDRKSVVIKYNCSECTKTIVFYNRCCLFIHAKGHAKGAKAYRLNINLATINALPDELLPSILSVQEEKEKHVRDIDKSKVQEKPVLVTSAQCSNVQVKPVTQIITTNKCFPVPKQMQPTLSYNPNFSVSVKNNKAMYNCPECSKSFWNVVSLQNHFAGKTVKTPSFYKCSKCLTDVIGSCTSKAHMRIHSKEQPYVCPECGEVITGSRDIFLKHLKQKCMHFQRTLLMRCKFCQSILLFDAETVANHYNECHSLKYYKCLDCPMAFKTEFTYQNHLESQHDNKGEHKLICKCPLCDTVFHQISNIEAHFRYEHWPTLVKNCFTAYKCISCVPNKVFNQKSAFVQHVTRAHGNPIVVDMCNECGEEFKSTDDMKVHRKEVHKDMDILVNSFVNTGKDLENRDQYLKKDSEESILHEIHVKDSVSSSGSVQQTNKDDVICTKCDTKFSDLQTYKKHMEKHMFVEKRKLVGTRVPSVKVKKLKLQDEKHKLESQKKSVIETVGEKVKESSISPKPTEFIGQVPTAPTPKPRNKCSECPARFNGAEELQEHLKIDHGISPQYPCHLCGNTYESQVLVERHVQVIHEGKSTDHPFLCWMCLETNVIKGYGSWKMLEKHLMNNHKLHKNNIDYSKFPKDVKEEGDSESVSSRRSSIELEDHPVKRLKVVGDSLFNCAKCSFQVETRKEFVQHIVKHKPDELSFQCLECGLCFAVLPSLKRHLFVVHKIRDFLKYQEESGCVVEELNGDNNSLSSPLKLHISQIPNGIAQPNLDKLDKKKEVKKAESCEENTLECNVCYKTFDTDAARRKHMRMHGMAFIRSRRAPVPAWE